MGSVDRDLPEMMIPLCYKSQDLLPLNAAMAPRKDTYYAEETPFRGFLKISRYSQDNIDNTAIGDGVFLFGYLHFRWVSQGQSLIE
jgi:hypothetical protein